MGRIGRIILAVMAGAVLWAVCWNLGTMGAQAAFPGILVADQPITHAGILVAYIAYSVVLSIAAGFVTALVGKNDAMTAVGWLAALQLSLGIAFEVSFWNTAPVWYHLIFLALVVPATVYGGKLRVQGQRTSVHAMT